VRRIFRNPSVSGSRSSVKKPCSEQIDVRCGRVQRLTSSTVQAKAMSSALYLSRFNVSRIGTLREYRSCIVLSRNGGCVRRAYIRRGDRRHKRRELGEHTSHSVILVLEIIDCLLDRCNEALLSIPCHLCMHSIALASVVWQRRNRKN
jgi:hypothetical protein